MLRHFLSVLSAGFGRTRAVVSEVGQTTAEYALVILGAAAIGTLVLTWATKSHAIGKLFDTLIGKILPG